MWKDQISLLNIPKVEHDTFVLIQLPDSLPFESFCNNSNNNNNNDSTTNDNQDGSHENSDKDDDATDNLDGSSSVVVVASLVGHTKENAQACLVTHDKSFSLSRVETSNAYVLIPSRPPLPDPSVVDKDDINDNNNNNNNNNNLEQDEKQSLMQSLPQSKRQKTTDTTTKTTSTTTLLSSSSLVPTPCRLLGGGSGAYFLELNERSLDLKALEDLLNVFDPYDKACTNNDDDDDDDGGTSKETVDFHGVSLEQLKLALQMSTVQIKDGLKTLMALEYQGEFCLLSEEAWQEARRAILGALSECDEFAHYATTTTTSTTNSSSAINRQRLIQESMKRISSEMAYPQLQDVIQLVLLRTMTKMDKNGALLADGDKIQIDFEKVAIIVAHELFSKPIWSHDDLAREWQAKVPGVGQECEINVTKLLRGVAICNNNEDDDHGKSTWHYLPADKLAKSPEERLTQLFAVRETWTKGDLEPYLEPLTQKVDEVLIKYARTVSQEVDGTTFTMFVAK